MILIDKIAYSSAIRYKSPFLKTGFSLSVLLICVGVRSFVMSLIVIVMMGCLTVLYSRTSLLHYLKLMIVPLAFLAMGNVAILINITDMPNDFFNLAIGNKYLTISCYSFVYSIRLIAVSLASVSCLYFLTLTTPMLDIMCVLKSLGCPSLIIEIMMLTYRYIFVLFNMASTIMTAQNCRLGNITMKSSILGMGNMLSVVLVRAMSKANILFDAMESRCYEGKINVIYENSEASLQEKTIAIVVITVLLIIGFLCRYMKGI